MKRAIVVVAGGTGLRMGGEIPKQYLTLAGKPIIVHVLERFQGFDPLMEVVVVMASSHRDFWDQIQESFPWVKGVKLAEGGESRYDSVKNGLKQIEDQRVVGIHDAVRPLVSVSTLDRCYASALEHGSGIPVIDMEDSVRILNETKGSRRVDRTLLRRVQTPQVFLSGKIKKAYEQFKDPSFTDDASVYEAMYGEVTLVEGNRENIKITTPADMKLAEGLIRSGD
jgi:2-C-methyl-D-erythritol 4-phosphate cytidylyltransferase